MKTAIVYDRVNKFGGAERVLLEILKLYPTATLFTLVHDPNKAPWSQKFIKVVPTFINRFPFFRSRHELLSPIAPLAFETLNFDHFDLVISVTSSDAKAILTKPSTKHVCLCLTPTRYLWSGTADYQNDWKMKVLPSFLLSYFKSIDLAISSRPDEYLAISEEVQSRIAKYYQRESTVIYPPIPKKFFIKKKPISKKARKYYLLVSRLVPYKKIDQAILSFNYTGLPLKIVGEGSESNRLKSIANSNITFMGKVSDKKLIQLYRYAKALIFPQLEDFGLVAVEAQACGTPVIAYNGGGAKETVINQETGLLYSEQSTECLTQAVLKFEETNINYLLCQNNAKKFTPDLFRSKLSAKIEQLLLK